MSFSLEPRLPLSGDAATIYSIKDDDRNVDLFNEFLQNNGIEFAMELGLLLARLKSMGLENGANDDLINLYKHFKFLSVGSLRDKEKGRLRVYVIHLSDNILILGGGGHKPESKDGKDVVRLKEIPELKTAYETVVEVGKRLDNLLYKNKTGFSENGLELQGKIKSI